MKCEQCGQKEASFFYEENINGKKRTLRLCPDCAAKLQQGGMELPSLAQLQNDFFGGLFGLSPAQKETKKTCPGCGAGWSELRREGKAFCPRCYEAFGAELEPTLRSIHGHVSHSGRAPAGRRAERAKADKLAALKTRLQAAIAAENFEEAAVLRDEIRQTEGK